MCVSVKANVVRINDRIVLKHDRCSVDGEQMRVQYDGADRLFNQDVYVDLATVIFGGLGESDVV